MRNETDITRYEHQKIMQHYRVTMANHELSAVEMRIMATVILKLKDAQISGFGKEVKDVSDLFDKFNRVTIRNADLVVGDNYKEVRNALKSLTKRDIELKKDGGTYFFNLIREAYYSDDRTTIDVDISPHILPNLIEIGKNYTTFGLEFLFKTKSPHSIRWYQIGSHWLNTGVFNITVNEIRELFKVQDKYPKHAIFYRWVIRQPFNEINEKSDITLNVVKTHKEGRSIIGYTISVSRKKSIEKLDDINFEKDLPQMLKRYMQKQSDTVKIQANKCNYDFNLIRKKLVERGIPGGVSNQRHFDNMTDKFIATILSKDGQTKLTFEQMLKELKEK